MNGGGWLIALTWDVCFCDSVFFLFHFVDAQFHFDLLIGLDRNELENRNETNERNERKKKKIAKSYGRIKENLESDGSVRTKGNLCLDVCLLECGNATCFVQFTNTTDSVTEKNIVRSHHTIVAHTTHTHTHSRSLVVRARQRKMWKTKTCIRIVTTSMPMKGQQHREKKKCKRKSTHCHTLTTLYRSILTVRPTHTDTTTKS